MKKTLAVIVTIAQFGGLFGSGATRAAAQVLQVPAEAGMAAGGAAGAGLSGVGSGFTPAVNSGMPSFDDPKFFVLQGISAQLDKGGRAGLVAGLTTALRAPSSIANPGSPEVIARMTIARAVLNSGNIPALGQTLRSINPDLGSRVTTKLQDAARAAREGPSPLKDLERSVAALERAGAGGPKVDGLEGLRPLAELFLGPLRSGPSGYGASAAGALPSFIAWGTQAADLRPSPPPEARLKPAAPRNSFQASAPAVERAAPQTAGEVRVWTEDVEDMLAILRAKAAHDRAFEAALKNLALAQPGYPAAPGRTFLLAREPRLLHLLQIPDSSPGGNRLLADGHRNLAVVIVASPANGFPDVRAAQEAIMAALAASAASPAAAESTSLGSGVAARRGALLGSATRSRSISAEPAWRAFASHAGSLRSWLASLFFMLRSMLRHMAPATDYLIP